MKSFGPVQQKTASEETEPEDASKETALVELTQKDYALARMGDPDAQAKVEANDPRSQEDKDREAAFNNSDIGQMLNDIEVQPLSVDEAQVALDTAIAAQAKGINDFIDAYDQMALDADVRFAQMDLDDAKRAEVDKEAATSNDAKPAEVDKEAATKSRAEMTPFERKQARVKSRRATMENGGMAASVSPEDAARAKAQAPAMAKASMPTGTKVQTAPTPESATSTEQATDSKSTNEPTSNKELFEQMVKNQEQTNKLLKSGNRITSDLSDEF